MTPKMRTLLTTISMMALPTRPKAITTCINLLKKFTILLGTTELEMTEIATTIAVHQ